MPKIAISFTTLMLAAAAAKAQTPAAPVPTFPSDKAINVSTATSIKWHKTAGATGYAVQLALDTGFTAPILDDSALTDTLDHVSHLLDTTVYYWRVRAMGPGGFGPYSKVRSFTTTPPLDVGPSLVAPEAASTVPAAQVTLIWNSYAGASTYAVQISTENNFSALLISDTSIADTSYKPKGLAPATAYYWHVRANTSPVHTGWTKGFFSTADTTSSAVAVPMRAEEGFRATASASGSARSLIADFALAKPGHARVTAFRLDGQVMFLADAEWTQGNHRVTVPARAGLWWVRLESEGSVKTRSVFVP